MASNHERDGMFVLSVLRLAFGAGTLAAPGVLSRFSGVEASGGAKFMARVFASRELALALITLHALDEKHVSARVLEANMLVDGLDGLAGLVAGRRLPWFTRLVTLAGAAGAVATAAALHERAT